MTPELLELLQKKDVQGKHIHDANLIVAAQFHNLTAIISADGTGLSSITVLSPAEAVVEMQDLV